jgi:hypothetical protein
MQVVCECLASIYHVPLQAPIVMARQLKSSAAALDAVLTDVEIKHPLVCHNTLHFYIKSLTLRLDSRQTKSSC